MNTKIEWADMTINPVVGCSKCSPGCDNCYAERQAARLAKNPKTAAKYAGVVDAQGKWTGRLRNATVNEDGSTNYDGKAPWDYFNRLGKKQKRIFVGSMTDIFHENMHKHDLAHIMYGIERHPEHIFMLLTKRHNLMRERISLWSKGENILPNLWIGVTVCTHGELHKLDVLRDTPAALRFVSFEPLLAGLGTVNLSGIDWVICGGETGPGARPMHPDWVRGLRDQCVAAGVPFYFKQMSNKQPIPTDLLVREFPDANT